MLPLQKVDPNEPDTASETNGMYSIFALLYTNHLSISPTTDIFTISGWPIINAAVEDARQEM